MIPNIGRYNNVKSSLATNISINTIHFAPVIRYPIFITKSIRISNFTLEFNFSYWLLFSLLVLLILTAPDFIR